MPKQPPAFVDENGDIIYDYDPNASQGFLVVQPGHYMYTIEDCPIKKGPKGPYIALRLRMDPAPGQERGPAVFENVSFAAPFRISQLQDAIWGREEGAVAEKRRLNILELHNQRLMAFTTVGRTNAGRPRNEVGALIPANEMDKHEIGSYEVYEDAGVMPVQAATQSALAEIEEIDAHFAGTDGGTKESAIPFEEPDEAWEAVKAPPVVKKAPPAAKKAAPPPARVVATRAIPKRSR